MNVVEVLTTIRSSRFDLPLTYDAGDLSLQIGDVVCVPLGPRTVPGFVISAMHEIDPDPRIKTVRERLGDLPAFDDVGLHLARFIAERYVCTLGEAIGAVAPAQSVPKVGELLERTGSLPSAEGYPSVPTALLDLLWEDFPLSFARERVLRHPAARRLGDRRELGRYLGALVAGGALRRTRRSSSARSREFRLRVLFPGQSTVRGPKVEALQAFVAQRPGVPRAQALLAGFSAATILRALRAGALREADVLPNRQAPAGGGLPALSPTLEQAAAIDEIAERLATKQPSELLLFGVTGSGKTYVYLAAIDRVLRAGGRAIVLVPEIALTPQTARRFEDAFGGRVAVLHSALSDRERFDAWAACMRGEVDVVVGARSAVFAPLQNVRLIVVDESHETSYKQETVPRYHAVEVARERMRRAAGVLVLGSATPSLESYAAATSGRMGLVRLQTRATQAEMPNIHVINLTAEFESGNRHIFSARLAQALEDRLVRGEKSVLFVNRRGTAGFLLCRSCGDVPTCTRCSVSLAVHRSEGILRCHYCDLRAALPSVCPRCGAQTIREFGIGTERVAQEVLHMFPHAHVVRMDSDTTTRIGDHARLLDEFAEAGDVLVGTQMVAKGLDFPTVTLVGVVAADLGLHVPEFRAAERTFSLITQVCGRSGRVRAGEAIVQTYSADHPAIAYAAAHDYAGFAAQELEERRMLAYPPATHLIALGAIGRLRAAADEAAQRYAALLRECDVGEVLGPSPYPIARMNDEWRFRFLLKTNRSSAARAAIRERLVPLARADRATRLVINVDP
ncbi:MAG: replication restart helicase PriA [Vulcanimicrobiaceae bacterium]